MVGGDHQACRVWHAPAHLGQPAIGGVQHPHDPGTGRIERGPPGVRKLLCRHRTAEYPRQLGPGPGAPAHLAGVRQEDDGTDDTLAEGRAVSVDVVGRAAQAAVRAARVGHERDRVGVAAKRGAGQRQPSLGRLERDPDRLAPGQRVASVMDLVEDHQRALTERALTVQRRVCSDLSIGHGHAGEVGRRPPLRVSELRIERDTEAMRREGPLMLQVFGRRDDSHGADRTARDEFRGDRQRERSLPGAGRRDEQEVALVAAEVRPERILLPAAERQEQVCPDRLADRRSMVTGGGCRDSHRSERLPAAADTGTDRHVAAPYLDRVCLRRIGRIQPALH